MSNLYLEAANRFLAKTRLVEALPNLIHAYEEDPNCKAALEQIYAYYVEPHEDNFRYNFAHNCEGLQIQGYEDCTIDFIPMDDDRCAGKYILYSKTSNRFEGELDTHTWAEPAAFLKKGVSGLLIADCWDIREFLPVLREKQWPELYLVLNTDMQKKFLSFFKLPGLRQILQGRLHFFETTEEMRSFFLEHQDAYLPRRVIAPEPKQYAQMIQEVHAARIQSGISSDHVFLSVCIPSFNRGERALEAVKHALRSEFDVEIEIIVSNNGSIIGKESYQKIKNMPDSRVRYYEFEENRGVAANIYNCLEKAKGRFAVFFSDEDTLSLEHVGEALDYLNSTCGISSFIFNATERCDGNEFSRAYPAEVFRAGKNAVLRAFRANYITGVCFNMNDLSQLQAFQNVDLLQENEYYLIYPHCCFAALLGKTCGIANAGLTLWNCGVPEKAGGIEAGENGVKYGEDINQRLAHEIGSMQLAQQILSGRDYEDALVARIVSTFGMLSGSYSAYGNVMKSTYRWIDICKTHYENCMEMIRTSAIEDYDRLVQKIDDIFLDWLDCQRIRKWFAPNENLKATLRAEMAKYYYNQGVPFSEIDFEKIDEGADCFIGELTQ